MRTLVSLLIASAALAAPVPRSEVTHDPLGRGYMGVFSSTENTLTIRQVIPNTPASEAGLQAGDIFVRVGPLKPIEFEEIRTLISTLRPGTRIDIVVKRGKVERAATIVLASKPDDADRIQLIDPQP